jgi:hypothetical protein
MQECLDKFENVETSYKAALTKKEKKVTTEFPTTELKNKRIKSYIQVLLRNKYVQ